MSEERERRPNYNPADYAQLKVEAISMTKEALEEDYVLNKDKKHTRCGDKIGITIAVFIALAMLIGLGYVLAESIIEDEVSDNIIEISKEVCPILGEGYISNDFFKSDFETTQIICNDFNSVPK